MAFRSFANHVALLVPVLLSAANVLAGGEVFDAQERAGRHAIEMNKPAQDFFEGGVLGNGGLGAIVCGRPDAVVIY